MGLYMIHLDSGERSFSYWRSTSAARSLFTNTDDFDALNDCDMVYLTGITLAIISTAAREKLLAWIKDAKTRGVVLGFDSNYRPTLWEDIETARSVTEQF